MGKIIAVTNQKGGVGKTTSCVNLAAYIACAGKKVLLIDIDPQGNACSSVGVEIEKEQNSIYDVLDEGRVEDKYYINEREEYVLNAWDEFYQGVEETVIGFPIWAEYFRDKDEEEDYPAWKKEFVRKNKR